MKTFFVLLSIGIATCITTALDAQPLYLKKDLQSTWLMYKAGHYMPYEKGNVSTIYLRLDTKQFRRDYFEVRSSRSFDLFINGRIAGSSKSVKLSMDSLSRAFASQHLLVAVRQPDIHPGDILTSVLTPEVPPALAGSLVKREPYSFRDFAIVGALVLIIMLLVIIRLNPKLAADYVSFTRIFSMREGDEGQLYTRIGNTTNVMFYVFCSLLISYYLIIIFHFVTSLYPIATSFQAETFGGILVQWLRLSFFVLIILFLKIILVFILSYLFGINEVPGIHMFNWIRFILVFLGALTIILFIYFIWHGQSAQTHSLLLKLLAWITGIWMIVIFFKLSSKVSTSMFHLFSYICATELIPFFILIKVLYN